MSENQEYVGKFSQGGSRQDDFPVKLFSTIIKAQMKEDMVNQLGNTILCLKRKIINNYFLLIL
jgi:hypothetical protein